MTEQEIFNTVWNGLASQGFEQSMTTNYCQYRGDNGRKCAAGWLIPDEVYTPQLEGLNITSLTLQILFESLGLLSFISLISRLQRVHDKSSSPIEMERLLRDTATRYGLIVPSQPSLPL